MAQFSVHENQNPASRTTTPFLLDIQSDLLSGLATRLVVPLVRPETLRTGPMNRLAPVLPFREGALVAMIPEMAAIPRQNLGPLAGDLAPFRGDILGAVDFLLTGF